MGEILGRKQRIKNSEWIEAFAKIEQAVSRKELDQLVDKTVKEIKRKPGARKPHMHGAAERIPWSWGKSAIWRG